MKKRKWRRKDVGEIKKGRDECITILNISPIVNAMFEIYIVGQCSKFFSQLEFRLALTLVV